MAWKDFIKRLRQDEEEELRNDQRGGVGNKVFGFLDDVLDAGDWISERRKDALGVAAGAAREFAVKPIVRGVKNIQEARADSRVKTYESMLEVPEEERRKFSVAGGIEDEDLSDDAIKKKLEEARIERDKSKEAIKINQGDSIKARAQRALLGNEDIHGLSGDMRIAQEKLEKKGIDPKLAGIGAGAYGVGMMALDLPGGSSAKGAAKEILPEAAEQLAKITDPKKVSSFVSKAANISKKQADEIAESIAKTDSADEVAEFVNTIVRSVNAPKNVDEVADAAGDTIKVYRGGDPAEPVNFVSENIDFAQRFADDAAAEGRPSSVAEFTINKADILDPRLTEHRRLINSVMSPKESKRLLDKTPSGVFLAEDEAVARSAAEKLGFKGVAVDELDLGPMPRDIAPVKNGSISYALVDPTVAKSIDPTDVAIQKRLAERPEGLRTIEQSTENMSDEARLALADGDPGQAGLMTAAPGTRTVDPITGKVKTISAAEPSDIVKHLDEAAGHTEAVPQGAREISESARLMAAEVDSVDDIVDEVTDYVWSSNRATKEPTILQRIRKMGGIKSSDYESLPSSLKNKNGTTMDEAAGLLGYEDDVALMAAIEDAQRALPMQMGTKSELREKVIQQLESGGGDLIPDQSLVDAYGLTKERLASTDTLANSDPPAQQFNDVITRSVQPQTPVDLTDTPGRKRVRSFLQTSKNNAAMTDEAIAGVDAIEPQKYTVQGQEPVISSAKKMVDESLDGAMRFVDDNEKWTDQKAAVLMELVTKGLADGRTDDVVELIKRIDTGSREAGRANAILAAWKRLSPEGVVKMAQREVDDIGTQGKLTKRVADLRKQVDKAGTVTQKDVSQVIDDVLKNLDPEDAASATVGEQVAKNVTSYMTPKKKKQVDTLVAELTKKIKAEMIAPKPGVPKRTAKEILQEVYKRGDEAAEAFPEAQDIVRANFADNPEVLKQLDDFFAATLKEPAASSTIDRAIIETMKENKTKISETIKKSWAEQANDVQSVAQKLVDNGFSSTDARAIAEEVTKRLNVRVDDAKKKVLERLVKDAPKSARPALEDKIARLSNLGAMNDGDYADLVRTRLDAPTLDNKTIEKISGLAQKMQGLEDGPEKNEVLKDILEAIADTMPVTGKEKFNAYRYQNLLASPRTQLRNVMANTFNALVTRPATLFTGAVGDAVGSAVTGTPRERFLREIPEYYRGMIGGYAKAQEAAAAAWKGTADITNPDFVDQFGKGGIQAARMRNIPKKWTVVSRLMEAQDRIFSGMIAGGEYAAQIARGVDEDVARKAADEMAEYSLLRQALDPKNATGQGAVLSKIDQASSILTDFANNVPGGRWAVPFIRTPLNFGKQWLEFSPAGLLNATAGDSIARRLGKEAMTDERRIEALNKGLLGTALTGLGVTLAMDDRLTWAAPESERERDLFYAEGKKPFSVKVGDKWVPLINFGPFGLALALPAAVKHNFSDAPESLNTNILEKIANTTFGMGEMLSQQTFLQGMGDLFGLLTGDENVNVEKVLASNVSQVIPLNALIRFGSTIVDPTYREASNILEYIQRDIPGLSKNLKAQTNSATGEETTRNWSDYVAPYSIGTPNEDPVRQGNTEMASAFYAAIKRGGNARTKTSEKITEALAKGDVETAQKLTIEHNQRVVNELAKFDEQYGSMLRSNPDLQKTFRSEIQSALIPLSQSSVNSRMRGLQRKREFADSLSR